MATSYLNPGGSGDRRACIILSAPNLFFSGRDPYAILDGTQDHDSFFEDGVSVVDKIIKFNFGSAVIIDEAKWYQEYDDGQGVWKWQGSNNDSDWTDIGGSFTLGGSVEQTQTELNGNITSYQYYRMLGISGVTSYNPYLTEITFKIDGTLATPSYYNPGGIGDRTASITVSASAGLGWTGLLSAFVNGVITPETQFDSVVAVADEWIKFDFSDTKRIIEAIFQQDISVTHGTWKWQGSNDDSNWTDIGSSFTLGGGTASSSAVNQTQTSLSGNTNIYRYYRLLGISGNTDNTSYILEFLFKTLDEDLDTVGISYTHSLAAESYVSPVGSGGPTYTHQLAAEGYLPITGTGNSTHTILLAATGGLTISGSGGVSYTLRLAGSGRNINGSGGCSFTHNQVLTGVVTYSQAALSYLVSLAVTGQLSVLGTATLSFLMPAMAAEGYVHNVDSAHEDYLRRFINDPVGLSRDQSPVPVTYDEPADDDTTDYLRNFLNDPSE